VIQALGMNHNRPSIGGGDANVIYGEGQGVITTTKDGQMATWTDQGIGRFTSDGHYIILLTQKIRRWFIC
jgi:hypothetical protein